MATEPVLANPIPLATGRSHKLPVVPVAFRVYGKLECLDPVLLAQGKAAQECKDFPALLPESFKKAWTEYPSSRQIESKGWGKPSLANGKWIYIFKPLGSGAVSLDSEIQVTASGEKQKAQYVSWAPGSREKWAKTYPRPATVSRDSILVPTTGTLYVFLSDEQLPYVRIAFYSSPKGFAALKARALEIPAGALSQSGAGPFHIDLVDAKSVVENAKIEADEARKRFSSFAEDESRAARLYMANFLWDLSKKEEKVSKWVRMGELMEFREQADSEARKLSGQAEAREAFHYALMLLDPFQATRDDLFSSDMKEMETAETEWLKCEAGWLGGAPASRYGLRYLEKIAEEDHWYTRLLLGGTEGLVAKKTLIGLQEDESAILINRFLIGRILWRFKSLGKQVTELTKIGSIQIQIIREIEIVVERVRISVARFGKYQASFLSTQTYRLKRLSRIEYKLDLYEANIKNLPTEQWEKSVQGLSKVCRGIVLAIEIGNLYSAVCSFNTGEEDEDGWNIVNIVDSACDTIGAIEKLAKSILKESGKKWFILASLLGSILDYFLYVRDIKRNLEKGRYGLAAAYTVMAMSATAMAAGASAELAGGAAYGYAAGPWLLIGAVLVILGAILVHLFTESEIEEWARDSCWGSRGKNSVSKDDLANQVIGLLELLSKYDADCFVTAVPIPGTERWMGDGSIDRDYDYFLVLRIKAGLFLKDSRFQVHLNAVDTHGIGSSDNEILIPGSKTLLLPDSGTRIRNHGPQEALAIFTQWWKIGDRYAKTRAELGRYEYALRVRLDFHGDGKTLFPPASKRAYEKSGDCDFVGLYTERFQS